MTKPKGRGPRGYRKKKTGRRPPSNYTGVATPDFGPGVEAIYGINPIIEALKAGRRKFIKIIAKEGAIKSPGLKEILDEAARRRLPVGFASIDEIANTVATEGHQGVFALVSPLPYTDFDTLLERLEKVETGFVVLLDGVTDPRNLGAVIRSAEAFGAAAVVIPRHKAASYTAVASKTSAGAGERMTLVQVANIAESVRRLKEEAGVFAVAFEGDAQETIDKLPSGKLAVVLGDEGTGVRPLTKKRCDTTVSIPMAGTVGSLNVSAAASIACYLASRK
jgi:23S rRNA (guanosine2251-2'-O)-methyltransferase